MNLIGHLACVRGGGPWLEAGAVLPDLLSLHRRKARLPALLKRGAVGFTPLAAGEAVVRGLALHHEVDVHFHKDALFLRTSRDLMRVMKEASSAPGLKRFLPAHVLAELWFDHLALQVWPDLAERFQAVLSPARRGTLARFAARDAQVDAAAFEDFVASLHSSRFGDGYLALDTVLLRMNRILQRFHQRAFVAEEEAALRRYFAAEAQRTRADVVGFVQRMLALCEGDRARDCAPEQEQPRAVPVPSVAPAFAR